MTNPRDEPATGDARTVLPGQPVTYHPSAPLPSGGIMLGTPIPAEPDPSKIIGALDLGAPPAPEQRNDADIADEIRGILIEYRGALSDPPYRAEDDELVQWFDRAVAALERVEAIDENGYDPITDTGASR